MTLLRSFAATALVGMSALFALPASAQIYFGGPRPPIVEPGYERDMRREQWRERREMERREAYEQGRRDSMRSRHRGPRCQIVVTRERDAWGRRVERRERVCRGY